MVEDDPWVHTVKLVLATNTPTSQFVNDLIYNVKDDLSEGIEEVKQSILESTTSRRLIYKSLNPSLEVHDVYRARCVNEIHRVLFTKLRVCGHNLATETGRWNRRGRGRIPLEERVCTCGAVQTELHVVESCPHIQPLHDLYRFDSWDQLMAKNVSEVVKISYAILSTFS